MNGDGPLKVSALGIAGENSIVISIVFMRLGDEDLLEYRRQLEALPGVD